MKINFNKTLSGLDGKTLKGNDETKPIKNDKGEIVSYELTEIKFSTIAINALMAEEFDEDGKVKQLDPVERVRRFALAQKITMEKKEADFELEDVVLIKSLIGKNYKSTLIVGASYQEFPK